MSQPFGLQDRVTRDPEKDPLFKPSRERIEFILQSVDVVSLLLDPPDLI